MRLKDRIYMAIEKFGLNLAGRRVLTEAATGNFVVTPIIAAVAGAEVTALTRDSSYGSVADVRRQTDELAEEMGVRQRIRIVTSLDDVDMQAFDIVTNCGFLRPLTKDFIARLSPKCVIPLMYEPWEYREGEIDLEACRERGIRVCGTNESDPRLRTMDYIGYIALYWLLDRKLSPFSAEVLVLGCRQFVEPIRRVLESNGYRNRAVTKYDEKIDVAGYNGIVIAEFMHALQVVGTSEKSYIRTEAISPDAFVIHIAGNVDFTSARFDYTPKSPRPFRYMSFTTDFIDCQAVIDLHTAGLKVGEGMLNANQRGISGDAHRRFMENQYPALGFDSEGWQ